MLDFVLAEQYRQSGRLALAKPLYEAIVKKDPTSDAFRGLVDVDRRADRPADLLTVLGELIEKTGSFDAIDKDAKSLEREDKLAAQLFRIAREKHGQATAADGTALRGAAALAAARKQFDVAREFYDLALQADPKQRTEILLAWGFELLQAEKVAEAVPVFRRGVEEAQRPDDKAAFEYYLAGALEMSGRTEAALATIRKLLAEQKSPDARYAARLPWILFHAKRNAEAVKAYRDLLVRFGDDYSSDDNRQTLRDAREALSAAYVDLHDVPDAEECLQQSLDKFPDDAGAQNDLGYLWADQGKHLQRALAMIRNAVAAEPDNAAYRDSLGWALFRAGRSGEAIGELKKAVAGDHPDAAILEHLGDVYEHVHNRSDALDTWKRALAGYERDKDKAKTKRLRGKIAKAQSAAPAAK